MAAMMTSKMCFGVISTTSIRDAGANAGGCARLSWVVVVVSSVLLSHFVRPTHADFAFSDESNWSYQSGEFSYLSAYLLLNTPRFPTLTGQASLTRMARTGTAALSVSVQAETSPADTSGVAFNAVLHESRCVFGGGQIYQDPYNCPQRCNDAVVDAFASVGTEVELNISVSIDSFSSSFAGSGHSKYQWGVHIPDSHTEALSVVLYDPDSGERMMCADLSLDRIQEGFSIGTINRSISRVPIYNELSISRLETGQTALSVSVSNVIPNSLYPIRIHTLPCALEDGGAPVRYGCIGSSCLSDVGPHLTLDPGSTATASGSVYIDELIGADARSIVIGYCESGVCPTNADAPLLSCLDVANQAVLDDSTTSRAADTTVLPTLSPTQRAPVGGGVGEQPADAVSTATTTTEQPSTVPSVNGGLFRYFDGSSNPCPGLGWHGNMGNSKSRVHLEFIAGHCCMSPVHEGGQLHESEVSVVGYSDNALRFTFGVIGLGLLALGVVVKKARHPGEDSSSLSDYAVPTDLTDLGSPLASRGVRLYGAINPKEDVDCSEFEDEYAVPEPKIGPDSDFS